MNADFRGKWASPTNHSWYQSSGVIALSCGIKISAVRHLVLSQYTRVTVGRTDGQTDGQNYDSQDRPRICSRGKKMKMINTRLKSDLSGAAEANRSNACASRINLETTYDAFYETDDITIQFVVVEVYGRIDNERHVDRLVAVFGARRQVGVYSDNQTFSHLTVRTCLVRQRIYHKCKNCRFITTCF